MDIPMMEEINSNTNDTVRAAKEAILAGTIDEEQLTAAVTEILEKMPAGGLTSVVKSVQAGYLVISSGDTSETVTINYVDVNKAVCFLNGGDVLSVVYLKDGQTVAARIPNQSSTKRVYYTVVEFY